MGKPITELGNKLEDFYRASKGYSLPSMGYYIYSRHESDVKGMDVKPFLSCVQKLTKSSAETSNELVKTSEKMVSRVYDKIIEKKKKEKSFDFGVTERIDKVLGKTQTLSVLIAVYIKSVGNGIIIADVAYYAWIPIERVTR